MAKGIVRGYTLTKQLVWDGSNLHVALSPDGVPVHILLTAAHVPDADSEPVLAIVNRYRKLHHPSLTTVRDAWVEGGYLTLVIDLTEGDSLANRLRTQGQFPARELVDLFLPLASAIDVLHDHAITHGGIQPSDIVLGRSGSRLGLPRFQGKTLAGVGVVHGYSAPEEAHGKPCLQTDQYSLAAVYVDLRRNRTLYSDPINPDPRARINAILQQREPDLEPLPKSEQRVLRRALAIDPAQRYPTCRTFVEELHTAVDRERE